MALIFIDNSSFDTDHFFDGGIQIAPGMQTNIVIQREFSFNLPKPYSNCDSESTKTSSTNDKTL